MITDNSTKETPFKYDALVFMIPLLLVFAIWFVYWIEYFFGLNFNTWGIYPRTGKGLRGILFGPFIHSGPEHLFNNSIPLFVLLASLVYFYRKIAYKVLFWGTILTGFLTWLIARPSFHIGISGVIYMLFSFIFFSGLIRKYYRLVALSLIVVFLYGGMVWYIFPIKSALSWEGHLSGFLVGIFFVFYYRHQGPQPQEYIFKQTEFDSYFDKDGNFNPPVFDDENTTQESDTTNLSSTKEKIINYMYLSKKKED